MLFCIPIYCARIHIPLWILYDISAQINNGKISTHISPVLTIMSGLGLDLKLGFGLGSRLGLSQD